MALRYPLLARSFDAPLFLSLVFFFLFTGTGVEPGAIKNDRPLLHGLWL